MQERKNNLFNKLCWKNCIDTYRIVKSDPYLAALTITKLKWNKDLNVISDNVKPLERTV